MEKFLLKKKWKKVKGGWSHPDEKEFGTGVYYLAHAYRLQVSIDQQGG